MAVALDFATGGICSADADFLDGASSASGKSSFKFSHAIVLAGGAGATCGFSGLCDFGGGRMSAENNTPRLNPNGAPSAKEAPSLGASATGAENNTYTPHSPRARAARFRKLGLSRPFGLLIKICMIALLVLAVVLFWQGLLWAWIVLVAADLLVIFAVWLRAEAAHIPIGPTEDINDLLSGDVLVILAQTQKNTPAATRQTAPVTTEAAALTAAEAAMQNVTPAAAGNLAKLSEQLATQTLSGRFLAVRLGMVPDLLAVVATMLEQRGTNLEQILAPPPRL